jgi:hypothetical protein
MRHSGHFCTKVGTVVGTGGKTSSPDIVIRHTKGDRLRGGESKRNKLSTLHPTLIKPLISIKHKTM